jgi:hypothetical protein
LSPFSGRLRVGDAGARTSDLCRVKQCDSLLGISGGWKKPANCRISTLTHFSAFQEIYLGCCTVAAQRFRRNIPGETRSFSEPN